MKKVISFYNSSGNKLNGIIRIPEKIKGGKAPGVIICHGFLGTKSRDRKKIIANELDRLGIASFRFDFTAHGESLGDIFDLSISQELDDLNSAYSVFTKNSVLDKNRLVLIGHSLGGLVSLMFAAQDSSRIKSLVLLAPVSDITWLTMLYSSQMYKEYRDYFIIKTKRSHKVIKFSREFFRDMFMIKVDFHKKIKTIDIPVNVIHGLADEVVPVSLSKRLEKKLACPKKFIYVPGADHLFTDSLSNYSKVIKLTLKIIKKQLL